MAVVGVGTLFALPTIKHMLTPPAPVVATAPPAQVISQKSKSLIMDKPHMAGFDGQKQAYVLDADRAIQDIKDPNIIAFEKIVANFGIGGGATAALKADKGVLNRKTNKLNLAGRINLTTSQGYVVDMESAAVDIDKGDIASTKPVRLQSGNVSLRANSIAVLDRGKSVTFDNGVTMLIQPEKGGADKEFGVSGRGRQERGGSTMISAKDTLRAVAGGFMMTAILIASPASHAAEQAKPFAGFTGDSKDPIQIDAVKLAISDDGKQRISVFTGDVMVSTGSTTMRANKMTVYSDLKKSTSGKSEPFKRLLAVGNVKIVTDTQTITSQTALYEPAQHTFTVTGNVIFTQGSNVITGDRLTIDTKSGTLNVAQTAGKRIRGVFAPSSDSQGSGASN